MNTERKETMEPHERSWVRLPLDGAFNVRELGGYPTLNGGQTKYHRFLRADGLGRITEYDKRFLYDYGVRAIIDLRDASEALDFPDPQIAKDVMYMNIPLLSFNAAQIEEIERQFDEQSFSMENIYKIILENYDGVRACFRFIAEAPAGCVLFHCAVGKDRTGILAMLLLSLAGVDKWDIIANYVQTWANLMRDDVFSDDWYDASRSAFRVSMTSGPELIEYVYDLMEEEHGGIEGYLLECGVRDEDVAAVRQRFLAD